jgi:hypothetical protein
MLLDEIPGGGSVEEAGAGARLARHDAASRSLIGTHVRKGGLDVLVHLRGRIRQPRGALRSGGSKELVLGGCAVQGQLQPIVVGLEGLRSRLKLRKLVFEIADVLLLALAKGTLTESGHWLAGRDAGRAAGTDAGGRSGAGGRTTHAARFCAFRRLCAGVSVDSLSSLPSLDRRRATSSWPSPNGGGGCCAASLGIDVVERRLSGGCGGVDEGSVGTGECAICSPCEPMG